MRTNCLLLLFLAFSLSTGSAGQDSPARPSGRISPREILDKYLAATGGLDRHRSVQTLVATGDFGLTLVHPLGTFRFYYKAPSSDVFELQMISHGESWVGRRDNRPFRRSTVEGVAMINGIGVNNLEEIWRALLEWDFSSNYSRIELIGSARVNKKLAYALRFTPTNGDPQVRYFDMESFLMVGMDQVQRFRFTKTGPETVYRLASNYSDYKAEDGLTLPRSIAISRAEGDFLFATSSLKIGIGVDDSIFKSKE